MNRKLTFTLHNIFSFSLFTYLFLFSVLSLQATDFQEHINDVHYLKDNSYSIENLPEKEFRLLKNTKLGVDNGTYWFKCQLDQSLVGQNVVLNIKEPTIGLIEVYSRKGVLTSSKKNQIGSWTSALELFPKSTVLYLKVDFPLYSNFPLEIYTEDEFRQKEMQTSFLKGLYYGYIFMVFILNLFFLIRFQEKSYLYYCIFLLLTNIGIAMHDGALFNYIDPANTNYFSVLLRLLIPLSGAMFATHFLSLRIYAPNSKKVTLILFIVTTAFYCIYFALNDLIFYALGDLAAILILSYYWLLGVVVYRKHEFAKFFVIGYSFILLLGVFFLIPLSFGINYIDLSLNYVKLGALFETLILTYAISYRIKMMQEENETYRLQINSYLSKIDSLKQENKTVPNHEEFSKKIQEIAQENQLTEREEEVLACLAKNMTNQEIADTLFVSVNTIKYHTRNIYQKLDLSNKKEVLTLFEV